MSNKAGELLRTVRSNNGMSQRALAARARVAKSQVTRIEAGATSPSVETLDRLLAAMGEELVLRSGPRADPTIRHGVSGPMREAMVHHLVCWVGNRDHREVGWFRMALDDLSLAEVDVALAGSWARWLHGEEGLEPRADAIEVVAGEDQRWGVEQLAAHVEEVWKAPLDVRWLGAREWERVRPFMAPIPWLRRGDLLVVGADDLEAGGS